jgi:flagellar biosynthesis protein FlhF
VNFETFRGRDVKEAIALVRAAFGADAIISSTRLVKNGRDGALAQSFVEVKAAPSEVPSASGPFPFARGDAARSREVKSSHRPLPVMFSSKRPEPKPAEAVAVATSGDAVEVEVRALRQLVERMFIARAPKERALAELSAVGIDGKLATELSVGLSKSAKPGEPSTLSVLRDRLLARVTCKDVELVAGKKSLIACVGPTGSGKTTTLAKLAAHASIERGLPLGIITLDTFRVGAVEQMRRFANLIGVPFAVASDEESLARALASSPDLVLIDTPSRGPRDEAAMKRLAACLAMAGDAYAREVLLALPAHARTSDVEDLARAYRRIGPTGCVITKLDETERSGGAVAGAIAAKLDIAFLCGGPRVPEDLTRATPAAVVDAVFPKGGLLQ